jgi:hypothetical protein
VTCLCLALALAQLQPFTPTQAVVGLIATAAARFLIPFFATDQGTSRFQTATGSCTCCWPSSPSAGWRGRPPTCGRPRCGMRHLEGQLHLALIELLAARLE